MRKALVGVLAAVMVFSLDAAATFAAEPAAGRYFVDEDADGICDVCGTGYGSCLTGNGAVFADADGDGVCDNNAAGAGRGNGQDSAPQGGRGGGGCGGGGFRGGRGR